MASIGLAHIGKWIRTSVTVTVAAASTWLGCSASPHRPVTHQEPIASGAAPNDAGTAQDIASDAGTDARGAGDATAAVAPPTPIDGALPVVDLAWLPDERIRRCDRGLCEERPGGPSRIVGIAATSSGAAMPAMTVRPWFHRIAPGASLSLARHEEGELLGVVLSGRVALRLTESPRGMMQYAGPWTAFMLPGSGAIFRAADDAPALLALIDTMPESPPAARPRERPRGGYNIHPLEHAPDLAWGQGAYHARIAFDASESPRASLGVLIASADAPVAEHAHAGAWEQLLAVHADGTVHAGEAVHVGHGDVLIVPPGVRHRWAPAGTGPLIAVQVYTPPGPEQRFRALADAGVP